MPFKNINASLADIEKRVANNILGALTQEYPKLDSDLCDKIFGMYTYQYLASCVDIGVASRAAWFSRTQLIPAVLDLEKRLATRFHKGALFHDTGVAHLLSGDENAYEMLLAMSDEEDLRKPHSAHKRGTVNLRNEDLAAQTITGFIEFASELLNGKISTHAADFAFVSGRASISPREFDAWRQNLDALHQFELLRIGREAGVFLGPPGSIVYEPVMDNPFVMLRLAKVLAHLAQWVESCLTSWQGGKIAGALSNKLKLDPAFGALSAAAGNAEQFAGHCPHGPDVELELRQLLKDLAAAPAGTQRAWRSLRILYIVRNSTAHTIDRSLLMYSDRVLLIDLLQTVFVSVFVICQLKGQPMP